MSKGVRTAPIPEVWKISDAELDAAWQEKATQFKHAKEFFDRSFQNGEKKNDG